LNVYGKAFTTFRAYIKVKITLKWDTNKIGNRILQLLSKFIGFGQIFLAEAQKAAAKNKDDGK
jgi:hypothetical protein